jgi:hypothetical protein
MTPTSPSTPPFPSWALQRGGYFAGGLQEKKHSYYSSLNPNETKSMDVRREPVIAPSTFASVRSRRRYDPVFSMWASEEAARPEPAFHDASRVTIEKESP